MIGSHGALLDDAPQLLDALRDECTTTPTTTSTTTSTTISTRTGQWRDDVAVQLALIDAAVRCLAIDAARFAAATGATLQWALTQREWRVRERAAFAIAALEHGQSTLVAVYVRPTPVAVERAEPSHALLDEFDSFDTLAEFLE